MKTQKTLRLKVLTWVSIPLSILWLVSAYSDYFIAKQYVNVAYDRSLLESALDIGRQVRFFRGRINVDLPDVAIKMLRSRESGQFFYLVTGPHNEYVSGESDLNPSRIAPSGQALYYNDNYRGQNVRVAVINLPLEASHGEMVSVQVAETLFPRIDLLREVLLRMALPQALLALLAGAVIWFSVGRGLAPLTTLSREIEKRSDRDLSGLSIDQVPAEVRPMIESTNGLLQRLNEVFIVQRRFIADAAHQLRTPIAGLRTQTELARRQTNPEEVAQTLLQIQSAAERTTHLINQLLSLARAEPSAENPKLKEKLALNVLAREVTADFVPLAISHGIDLGFEPCLEDPLMRGEDFLIREMLSNLIDNAIRYTPNGGQVTVRISQNVSHLFLTVEDNGPGIPEAEREAVLERFHRILGTGVEGAGLGLSIAREIVIRHQGEIRLLPQTQHLGTVAQIKFPLLV